MPICTLCGEENRASARFCYNCAAPLTAPRPSEEDQQWLAANLCAADASAPVPSTGKTGPLPSLPEEEISMDHQPTPPLFAGRFALPEGDHEGVLTVVDTQPWRRCWACGSSANESGDTFCNDCGAALTEREYQATICPTASLTGAALVATLTDEAAREVLPQIAEQMQEEAQVLTLLHDSGRPALEPPLDETTALMVGATLAQLVDVLHQSEIALGSVTPADLEAAPGGVRLRSVPNLRRFSAEERAAAVQSDLTALAELLEQLTETPRTTQRLTEDEAHQAISASDDGLLVVLRQIRTAELASADAISTRLRAILADRTEPLALRHIVGAYTDTGIVRDHNEDSFLTLQLGLNNSSYLQHWGIYIVSDGMGGHAAGEVASGIAVRATAELLMHEYLIQAMQPDVPFNQQAAQEIVRKAVLRANDAIVTESRNQGNDMGATMTMALVIGDRAIIGNVGDSRGYICRDGKLQRITKDHSLVQRLVDLGQISLDDMYSHPQRNAILRSLGDRAEVEVDVFSERVQPGDLLMICSDGQWEMTRDPEMERIMVREEDPQSACEILVAAANQAGGEDNIAVILVKFA
ncbi:Stp1/IreP family PP2C-type Ser/Thr phosphatase [Candidatus Viridilinea mediisalina]|uniref:Protein phosphatase n=1 Tax=Candidatus Viridilinea mediisalina TaxID=2024553 RepID=A0A2A6RL82_9CHLR|nr:Stp1/IreP family PP2C-type Ser/Thr phosphatase [Candidatus Viridilinea mediisalina]PDW03802.1 protein phosphatase [Candidatus Viridilinea mediisalina]